MGATKPILTKWDRIKFVGVIFRTVVKLLESIVTAGFRGIKGAPTFKRHVIYRTVRSFNRNISTKQMQASFGTSTQMYNEFLKKNSLQSEVVDLSDGTLGAWLGDKSEGTVILWLHGGGYAAPLTPGHLQLVRDLIQAANLRNANISCFFLQYDLAPGGVYPRQLVQAALALRYLMNKEGISPSRIIVAGDSAGGNLSLGLISHVLHSYPFVVPVTLSEPLKGLVLLSPWVTFDQMAPSMNRNAEKDMLDKTVVKQWSDAFLSGTETDNYNTPLQADADWWKDLPAKEVCILAGSDEIFVDDIEGLVKKLQVYNEDKITSLVAEGEAHDMPVFDYLFGFPPGTQNHELQQWILDRTSLRA